MAWRAAHAALTARVRSLPDAVRIAATGPERPPELGLDAVRRVVTTGIGSSAAHARVLAHVLAERLGCDARFRPLGAFLEPVPVDCRDDLLVVVSQGLSPNVRLALADLTAWRHVVVLTASEPMTASRAGRGDVARLLEHLAMVGVEVRIFTGADEEYGTLLRVTGPMLGYVAVLRYAEALAIAAGKPRALPPCDADSLAAAIARAPERVAALPAFVREGRLDGALVLAASGDYVALLENLRAKILEGLLLPAPLLCDLLELAHGPFQQAFPTAATFLACTRPDVSSCEEELLGRLETMLEPARHRVVRLAATLPSPWSVLEHEALLNEIVLAGIASRAIDQARWPGQGRDRPLYVVGADDERTTTVPGDRDERIPTTAARPPVLAELTWPELAALLAAGPRTALVPLGATEQHGPHLPFATDTWIADALALRLAARLPETVVCPTVPIGCSREHLGFPGTLDLMPPTLEALLADVLTSLARHGFAGAFVFSAHGGNCAALASMLPALAAAAAPMAVSAHTDLDGLAAAWAATAARFGVSPTVAGHHAGELETSIVAALRPDAVRVDALAAGRTELPGDPQTLFYPSLRDQAPNGTVGDPRAASATRAEAYLEAWVDVLVDAYRRAKNAT